MGKLHYRGIIEDAQISACTEEELETLIGVFEESIETMLATGETKTEFDAGDFTLTLVRETLNRKDHWRGRFAGRAKFVKVMAYLEREEQ